MADGGEETIDLVAFVGIKQDSLDNPREILDVLMRNQSLMCTSSFYTKGNLNGFGLQVFDGYEDGHRGLGFQE